MLINERLAQMAITRGLAQESTENALLRLYDEFCATGSQECLDDIIRGAEQLGWGIAYRRLQTSAHFRECNFEDYLQHIAIILYQKLIKEQAAGVRQENIVFTIRRFYDMRSRDLRDWLAVHYNGTYILSLDDLNETDEGKTRDVIADPLSLLPDERELSEQKEALFGRLNRLYINQILNHDGEPQRPIALLFSRLLYQLEMRFNPQEIDAAASERSAKDTRKSLDAYTKWVLASQEVQNPATTNSAKWATKHMAGKTMSQLTDDSRSSLRAHYDADLQWGQAYLSSLSEACPYDPGTLWQDIVYTNTFTEKKTSYWADLLHNTILKKLVAQIEADPELDQEVMALDSPIKSLMIRLGKEYHHDTSINR